MKIKFCGNDNFENCRKVNYFLRIKAILNCGNAKHGVVHGK